MKPKSKIQGVWTALATPMDPQGRIDFESFKRLLKLQIKAKVHGVIPCGTTGESATLTEAEKKSLILAALDACSGSKTKVFAGTGSNNTVEAVNFSAWANAAGVDGLLVVTPYYNKPTQQGLIAHFSAIAKAVDCPIMLYNVPGRTSVSMTAETVLTLSKNPLIQSLKEASGNLVFASEILDRLPKSTPFTLLSGDDVTFLPFLSLGGEGVVSVAANLFPEIMVQIWNEFQGGRVHQATALHQKFYPLFRDLFIETNPTPIKQALQLRGIFKHSAVRLPLVTLSKPSLAQLQASMKRCGLKSTRRPH